MQRLDTETVEYPRQHVINREMAQRDDRNLIGGSDTGDLVTSRIDDEVCKLRKAQQIAAIDFRGRKPWLSVRVRRSIQPLRRFLDFPMRPEKMQVDAVASRVAKVL